MKDLNHEEQYKLYEATTIVFSKPLYYGGRMFVKYNSITKKYYSGNSASTAVSTDGAITLSGVLQRELKDLCKRLEYLGYSEYKNDWSKDVDTYGNIKEAGL